MHVCVWSHLYVWMLYPPRNKSRVVQTATTKKDQLYQFTSSPPQIVCQTHTRHMWDKFCFTTIHKYGTSSPLPLHTKQVQDKFSFTITHKCGTSSPLSLHTTQKWDKFSFTTTHKCGTSSPLVFTTTHICRTSSPLPSHTRQKLDKFSFTTTHKTSAGQVLLYHHTQDKCGTSSPLVFTTTHICRTSSPLPSHTRQKQLKFSFTTTPAPVVLTDGWPYTHLPPTAQ